MRVETELAFVALNGDNVDELRRLLPQGLAIEDRTDRDWGLTVRDEGRDMADDLQTAINSLLEPLISIAEQISTHETVLRVSVYYDTATCTLALRSLEKILPFDTQLEITTYPVDNEIEE